MNKIEVSIIVPIYNAEKYVEACVNSILNQTFSNFELILVDDGSKDRSLEICEELAKKDSRIIVTHQENAGSSAAKNTGLKLAQGEYIAFCDADDTIDKEYIENLYCGVVLNKVDVCIGSFAFITAKDEEIISRREVIVEKGLFKMKEFMKFYPRYMPQAIIGSPCNKLYRHEIIKENGLSFNSRIRNNEDTHFNFEYLSKCHTVYVSNEPYYNYMNRVNVASASKGFIPNIFEIYTLTYKKSIEFLKAIGVYDEYIRFQNTYYIGLVVGAINGIVNGQNQLTKKEKLDQIRNICLNDSVRVAIRNANVKGIKKKIIVKLIKLKQIRLINAIFSINKWYVAYIKENNYEQFQADKGGSAFILFSNSI